MYTTDVAEHQTKSSVYNDIVNKSAEQFTAPTTSEVAVVYNTDYI